MRALERAFVAAEPQRKLRDLHAWLELLQELLIECREALTDPDARRFLGSLEGSSKAAKSARAVLAIEPGEATTPRRAAACAALAGRLDRAERLDAGCDS